MATDFFDDDLVREREAALKIKLDDSGSGIPRDGHIPSSRDLPNRPVGDFTLTHMTRHKQEVTEQMVGKAQELDRLRARQEELEHERNLLEEMRQKQEAFDSGRRELKDRLNESLVWMEKERLQADRLAHLLDETRRTFRERLDDVNGLKEEDWEDAHLLDELNKALVLLENVRADYNQALGKIDAIRSQASQDPATMSRMVVDSDRAVVTAGAQGFGYWLRAGMAFTLPLMLLLALLGVVWMVLYYSF
ncbi:MAG: hypothetical protein RBS84_03115 [Kiritimatiellia bacterium]|jgi:vacuolar-type H+-ATPase subunit I/STV1|nr:hypothetical protein [Kiritimatiellia bacterium]